MQNTIHINGVYAKRLGARITQQHVPCSLAVVAGGFQYPHSGSAQQLPRSGTDGQCCLSSFHGLKK